MTEASNICSIQLQTQEQFRQWIALAKLMGIEFIGDPSKGCAWMNWPRKSAHESLCEYTARVKNVCDTLERFHDISFEP